MEPHRGADGDRAAFARKFVEGRLQGFRKDIAICLTGTQIGASFTHAYFPALGSCCGTIEYLAGLYEGRLHNLGFQHWLAFAQDYLGEAYDDDRMRVLYQAFRHSVAHRGIASGIWVDQHDNAQGRRTTWEISELNVAPAISVVATPGGKLVSDPPWETPYTHRVYIHVGRLAQDIVDAANRYVLDLVAREPMLAQFYQCMEELYPRQ
jgi:hypothetical protein